MSDPIDVGVNSYLSVDEGDALVKKYHFDPLIQSYLGLNQGDPEFQKSWFLIRGSLAISNQLTTAQGVAFALPQTETILEDFKEAAFLQGLFEMRPGRMPDALPQLHPQALALLIKHVPDLNSIELI